MAAHSSILAWRIPWTEETGGLRPVHRVTRSQTRLKRLHTHALFLLRLSQNLPGPPRPIRGRRTMTCCPTGAKPVPKSGEGWQRGSGSPMSQAGLAP